MISLLYSKTNPCGTLAFPHRPVQDVGSPLAVCPHLDRPQHPELSPEPLHSWWGEHTWHLRQQSQISRLPVLTCPSCIAFSSLSLQRSRPRAPLPPILPVAARAALNSFGVSALGGMISGSAGPPFSSLGLLLLFSIFLQHGKGEVMSVRERVLLPGVCNAEKPSVKRTGIFMCLGGDRTTNLSNAKN